MCANSSTPHTQHSCRATQLQVLEKNFESKSIVRFLLFIIDTIEQSFVGSLFIWLGCFYFNGCFLFVFFSTCSVRSASHSTVDPDELRKFQSLANKWWDEQGEFAALHAMNDLRVPFIRYTIRPSIFIRGANRWCQRNITQRKAGRPRGI